MFQMSMVVLYPTVIQPLFNKLSPLAGGDLRTRIEALASKLKFPLKHLYEIDGSKRSAHSNAYFFGLPWVRKISHIWVRVELMNSITAEQAYRHFRHAHQAEQVRGSRGGSRCVSVLTCLIVLTRGSLTPASNMQHTN